MRWFGERYPDGATLVPVPAGELCSFCDEQITAEDSGVVMPHRQAGLLPLFRAMHRACFLRSIVGSVAHQGGRCTCFGGAESHDPPSGKTKRQAAEEALALYESTRDYHPPDLAHWMCAACWKVRNPTDDPLNTARCRTERCCFCGERTHVAMYYGDARTTRCPLPTSKRT